MNANTVIILAGAPCQLVYDKLAIYRADEVGAWGEPVGSVGFARAAKFVWAMLPHDLHDRYRNPQTVAAVLPPLNQVWPIINAAMAAAGEEMDPKNVFGSTNGRTPSSSSASVAKKTTGR